MSGFLIWGRRQCYTLNINDVNEKVSAGPEPIYLLPLITAYSTICFPAGSTTVILFRPSISLSVGTEKETLVPCAPGIGFARWTTVWPFSWTLTLEGSVSSVGRNTFTATRFASLGICSRLTGVGPP